MHASLASLASLAQLDWPDSAHDRSGGRKKWEKVPFSDPSRWRNYGMRGFLCGEVVAVLAVLAVAAVVVVVVRAPPEFM